MSGGEAAAAAIQRCLEPIVDIPALLRLPRPMLAAWPGLGDKPKELKYDRWLYDAANPILSERRYLELKPIVARQLAFHPLPQRAAVNATFLKVRIGALRWC